MTDASGDETEGRPSVALVVLDTLRKDAFDRHFDWLPGRRFESAWATSNWTVPVHASLFTGRYASEAGVHAKSPDFDYPGDALPERLSKAGYTTRAYSCNVNVSHGRGFDRGFDEFEGSWRIRSLGEGVFDWSSFAANSGREGLRLYAEGVWRCLRSDAPTSASLKRGALLKLRDLDFRGALLDDGAKGALRWLKRTDFGDVEFLFVNLMEAHSPYLPPRGYRTVPRVDVDCVSATLDAPTVPADRVRRAYDDSVRYLSDIYRRMYETIREAFDYVVTLSDHGELLGEHGAWDHLYGLFPELTRVPLVIDGPGVDGTVADPVSLLDVHATVLDIAGLDYDDSKGRPLLTDFSGCEFLTEYHGLSRIVIESAQSRGLDPDPLDREGIGLVAPPDYYGYETVDGFEEVNDWNGEGTPRERMDALVSELDRRETTEESPDDELRAHLADLGYV